MTKNFHFFEDLLFIWSLLLNKVHLSQISFVFSVWKDQQDIHLSIFSWHPGLSEQLEFFQTLPRTENLR